MIAPEGQESIGNDAPTNRAVLSTAPRHPQDNHAVPTTLTFTQQGMAEGVRVRTDAAADRQVHLPKRSRPRPRTP